MQKQTISVQTEMCMMLNCNLEKYRAIVYKNGVAYLHWYFPTNNRYRSILEKSGLYWAWYRLQWEKMDYNMLTEPQFFEDSIAERRKLFKKVHNPQAMAIDVKLSASVLAELNKKEVVACR